jgi:hypothetical protein
LEKEITPSGLDAQQLRSPITGTFGLHGDSKIKLNLGDAQHDFLSISDACCEKF